MSTKPDPAAGFPIPPADVPLTPDLSEVRDLVRRLEAQLSVEHGVDNAEYWRAMSDRLQEALARTRFKPGERAHRWLARVASAYGALAATSRTSS